MEHQWMFLGNQACPMPQSCPVIPESRNKMIKAAKERASTKEFKKGLYYKQRRFQKPGLKGRNKCIPRSSQPKAKNQAFKEKLSRWNSVSLCDPRPQEIEAGGRAPDQPGLHIQTQAQPLLAWSALSQSKLGMVAHICDSIIQEVGAGESGVQSQLPMHSEFQASLDFMRSCLKANKPNSLIFLTNVRVSAECVGTNIKMAEGFWETKQQSSLFLSDLLLSDLEKNTRILHCTTLQVFCNLQVLLVWVVLVCLFLQTEGLWHLISRETEHYL